MDQDNYSYLVATDFRCHPNHSHLYPVVSSPFWCRTRTRSWRSWGARSSGTAWNWATVTSTSTACSPTNNRPTSTVQGEAFSSSTLVSQQVSARLEFCFLLTTLSKSLKKRAVEGAQYTGWWSAVCVACICLCVFCCCLCVTERNYCKLDDCYIKVFYLYYHYFIK